MLVLSCSVPARNNGLPWRARRPAVRISFSSTSHSRHSMLRRVTHDYTDVAALGDRVAVMRDGKILQVGAASDVFRRPINRAVADIVGIENLLAGRVEGREQSRARVVVAGYALQAEARAEMPANGDAYVAIRAEDIRLSAPDHALVTADNRLAAKVVALQCLGALTKVTLDSGFRLVACLMTRDVDTLGLAPGASVVALVPAADVHILVP